MTNEEFLKEVKSVSEHNHKKEMEIMNNPIIKHLEEVIADRLETMQYNTNEINHGVKVVFYHKWNNELQIEIDALKIAIRHYELMTKISA